MARISYVNGRYLDHADAYVHMEDRGYQFADGIYEVIAFYNRTLVDEGLHLTRFYRSLRELAITPPMNEAALKLVMQEIIARNDRIDGTLYMQVTRGVAKRDHAAPVGIKPSLTMLVTGPKIPKDADVQQGITVISVPDIRWGRRDIKSIALLPNTLAKQQALAAGVRDAWLVNEQGLITEASASNAYIVNAKGEIVTHPLTQDILGGCTRAVVLEQAKKAGFRVIERAFSLKEALAAQEAFITGTTSNVLPIVKIDGKAIGNGKPGKVAKTLLTAYHAHITRLTGKPWN